MLELVVVVEAEADARQICSLADRIFVEEEPRWIDEIRLPNLRNWSGFEPGHFIYQNGQQSRNWVGNTGLVILVTSTDNLKELTMQQAERQFYWLPCCKKTPSS